jgi:hypothetical protein
MIKNSSRITSFTPEQRAQLERISKEQGLKTATDVLLFALDQYHDLKLKNEMLTRFNARKQAKIEDLQQLINNKNGTV